MSMGGCKFGNILTINVPKCPEGKFLFFDRKRSDSSEFYSLGPGPYPSSRDTVEVMKSVIRERHNHSKSCITVKVSRETQRLEVHVAKEGPGLAFFSTDLGHIFGNIVGNELGVMLREKLPHKPNFAYYTVHIQPLNIYTDPMEYKFVDDTKTQLLRCF